MIAFLGPVAPAADAFVEEMVAWLNHRFGATGAVIEPDTPLFEEGRVDSIAILKIIAWTEQAIGITIPDERIRMDNFRSVNRIAEVFLA